MCTSSYRTVSDCSESPREQTRLSVPLACLASMLMALGASACGTTHDNMGASTSAASSTFSAGATTVPSVHDGDGDIDRLMAGRYDTDNDAVPEFGPPADVADRRSILTLFGHYYAAAEAGDGARACSMLDALIAETLVEEHHHGKGPSSLQGDTCIQVISKLFRQHRSELAEDATGGYRVLLIQVRGNRGYVLVRFSAKRELRELRVFVRRVHGVWKMETPLDNGAQ
jgi:hypothetical protein